MGAQKLYPVGLVKNTHHCKGLWHCQVLINFSLFVLLPSEDKAQKIGKTFQIYSFCLGFWAVFLHSVKKRVVNKVNCNVNIILSWNWTQSVDGPVRCPNFTTEIEQLQIKLN